MIKSIALEDEQTQYALNFTDGQIDIPVLSVQLTEASIAVTQVEQLQPNSDQAVINANEASYFC